MRCLRHSFLLAAFCALAALSVLLPSARTQTIQIDPLKANFLSGFLDFVRWEGSLQEDDATIGIMGSKELYTHLKQFAQSKPGGREIHVVLVEPGDDLSNLQVLYVAAGNRSHWNAIAEACRRHRILLVGEEENFIQHCGMIEFVVRKNRLRFRLNLENAKSSGIEISSKLVEIALDQ